MPPKKKKPATTLDAPGASPAPPATSAVPTLAPAGPKTLRIARVVSPPARTRPGSLPQSIEGFAAGAASSLEALRAILTDADADALLARHPDLSWDDAVIQSAEAAVERTMLEAPAVRLPDPDHRPPLALPSAERARAADSPARHKRKAVDVDVDADADPDVDADVDADPDAGVDVDADASPAAPAAAPDPDAAPPAPADPLPVAVADSLSRAAALPLAEAAAPLRCLRARDAAAARGLQSRPNRRRFKTSDDVHRVPVASADAARDAPGDAPPVRPGVDVLVGVAFHNPANPAQVLEEFLCLGRTKLSALRDCVRCQSDDRAVEAGLDEPGARNKNGFFFVEGTFHNSFHDSSAACDYSEPARRLQATLATRAGSAIRGMRPAGGRDDAAESIASAREKATRLALGEGASAARARRAGDAAARDAATTARRRATTLFDSRDAARTTVGDLTVVRGKPYLFCHQGDCEHLLTIRSVRLAHADDPRRAESYPLRTLDGRRFRRKCSMCDVFEARHVTYGDRLAPCSPCFFCETCHDTLHLDAKGAPLYDEYERYEYHHE